LILMAIYYQKIKRKVFLLFFGIYLLFYLLYLFYLYGQQQKRVHAEYQNHSLQLQKFFAVERERLVDFYNARIAGLFRSKAIIQAVITENRPLLRNLLEERYRLLLRENPFLTAMHFHSARGASLLRLHRPEMYGDNLLAVRPMIRQMQTGKKALSGFEEGYFGIAFRIMQPLLDHQGKLLGSLEFGVDPEYFGKVAGDFFPGLDLAMLVPKSSLQLYLKKKELREYKEFFLLCKNTELFTKGIGYLDLSRSYSVVSLEGRTYLFLMDLYLKDYRNLNVIQMVMARDVSQWDKDFAREFISLSILSGLLFFLSLFIINIGFNWYISRLRQAIFDLENLHSLFDEGDTIIIKWKNNSSWDVSFVTENIKKVFGYSRQDFLSGRISYSSLINPNDLERVATEVKNALQRRDSFFIHEPYRLRTAGGDYLWLHDSTRLLYNARGEVETFLGYLNNISDLVKVRNEIQVANERFELAVAGSNDGLWDWNVKTNEVYFSPRWKQMLGYQEQEIVDHLDFWSKLVHPDDHEGVMRVLNYHLERKSDFYESTHRLLCKDGSYKWILDRGKATFNSEGKPVRVVGFHSDLTEKVLREQRLRGALDELEAIFKTTRDGIAILDKDSRFLDSNPAYLHFTGYSRDELLQTSCIAMSAPEFKERSRQIIQEVLEQGFVDQYEKVCIVKDGRRVLVTMSMARLPGTETIVVVARDITQSQRQQAELRRYVEIVDKYVLTASTDLHGTIRKVSSAFSRVTGYPIEEIVGFDFSRLRHPDAEGETFSTLWGEILKGNVWHGELKNRSKNGEAIWFEADIVPGKNEVHEISGYTAIYQDITDKKYIEKISITDPLTQIYNRMKLDEVLHREWDRACRYDHHLALLMIDIDHFKSVNDTFGHQVGDQVLKSVAQILSAYVRQIDAVGRWGGEEFVIIAPHTDVAGALSLAEKIRHKIEEASFEPVANLTVSIGVGSYHQGEAIEELIKKADDSLYHAKRSGRNQVAML